MFGVDIHWTMDAEFGEKPMHYVENFLATFPLGTEPSNLFNDVCADFGLTTEPKKDEMGTTVNTWGSPLMYTISND